MATEINKRVELADKLIEILGLPKRTVDFSIHFPMDGVVSVKCEYYPDDLGDVEELTSLFKEYRLEEIEDSEDGQDLPG